jgi:hypothetical protein
VRALNTEWTTLAASPRALAALDAWHAHEGALTAYPDFDALHAASTSPDPAVRDAVLLALIRRAQAGPYPEVASRTVLQLMLPWVRRAAARLRHRFEDYDDAVGALCGEMLARVRAYPLSTRPAKVAANLSLDTLHALTPRRRVGLIVEIPTDGPVATVGDDAHARAEGWELADTLAAALHTGIIDRLDPALHRRLHAPSAEPDARDELLALLVRAVGDRVVTRDEARLTAQSACRDGAGDRAVAAATGCSLAALRQRRSRTVARLRAAFGDQHRDTPHAA